MFNSLTHIFTLVLILLSLTGCGKKETPAPDISELENCDSIPDGVKKLVKAVADNDSVGFSAIVSYPLSRPYPLHDIENAEEMKNYYPVMVDDSLRNVLTASHPKDWEEYGWRGWSLKNGDYLWVDSDIYDISYLSARERAMLDSLKTKEMESIENNYRAGWSPVMCLKGTDNGAVYRIDASDKDSGIAAYRLLVYAPGCNLRGVPAAVYTGNRDEEGTAATIVYHFKSNDGLHATFIADASDGSVPSIEFSDSIIRVKRTYWLDLTNDTTDAE